jgi:hypothetical protein
MKQWVRPGVLALALFLVSAATGLAALQVQIAPHATLHDRGQTVVFVVAATCDPGSQVLEAFAYVVQQGNQSSFGPFQPVCDGKSHRHRVRVQAQDRPFVAGPASVSGFVLLSSGESVSPTQNIRLHGGGNGPRPGGG